MLKNYFYILSLILIVSACYTIQSHPVVTGIEDGQYFNQQISFTDDCMECHSQEEVEEFNLMPLYEPEKVHGDMAFYSDEVSHISLFYGEVGWWYRYSPVVTRSYESNEYWSNDNAGRERDVVRPIVTPVPPAGIISNPGYVPSEPENEDPPKTITRDPESGNSSSSGNSSGTRNSGNRSNNNSGSRNNNGRSSGGGR